MSTTDSVRQLRRPPGRTGPARDPSLDIRILDAALALLVDSGYAGMTMERVAARAGVGKPTVYRRWATRADLAAEAFVYAGVVNDKQIVTHGPEHVRDELIDTIGATAQCAAGDSNALLHAMNEMGRQHPEIRNAIADRYSASIVDAIGTVLDHARERGDDVPDADTQLSVRVAAAVALLMAWQARNSHDAAGAADTVASIVDYIILSV